MPGSSGYPGSSGDPGAAAYPGSGGSGSMMPGSGGYPGSYSAAVEVAQYKLIRFFDTDVQAGRVYRYRVRVLSGGSE